MSDYPDDNPKTVFGSVKPGIKHVPTTALLEVGRVMDHGAKKYGPYNWRDKTVSSSVYYDAAVRHLMQWWDGEDMDSESGCLHLAHAMACIGIVIDGSHVRKLNDDRPTSGDLKRMIEDMTKRVQAERTAYQKTADALTERAATAPAMPARDVPGRVDPAPAPDTLLATLQAPLSPFSVGR